MLEFEEENFMKPLIAYCGLDCEKCEARQATIHKDDEKRKEIAERWSELNHVKITPEMINCLGCRVDGPKTPYCELYCPIRKCALAKGFSSCGLCPEVKSCQDIKAVMDNSPEAVLNLKESKE